MYRLEIAPWALSWAGCCDAAMAFQADTPCSMATTPARWKIIIVELFFDCACASKDCFDHRRPRHDAQRPVCRPAPGPTFRVCRLRLVDGDRRPVLAVDHRRPARRGRFLPGLSTAAIDRSSGVAGLGEALLSVGWIELVAAMPGSARNPCGIRINHFDEHNSASAKKGLVTAKRVAKHRHIEAPVTPPPLQIAHTSVSQRKRKRK